MNVNNKLSPISKILLATGQINYIANVINSSNEQIKMIPFPPNMNSNVYIESIKERDDILQQTWQKLSKIMEDLADLQNNQDMTFDIDERIGRGIFDILLCGKDDIEDDE